MNMSLSLTRRLSWSTPKPQFGSGASERPLTESERLKRAQNHLLLEMHEGLEDWWTEQLGLGKTPSFEGFLKRDTIQRRYSPEVVNSVLDAFNKLLERKKSTEKKDTLTFQQLFRGLPEELMSEYI